MNSLSSILPESEGRTHAFLSPSGVEQLNFPSREDGEVVEQSWSSTPATICLPFFTLAFSTTGLFLINFARRKVATEGLLRKLLGRILVMQQGAPSIYWTIVSIAGPRHPIVQPRRKLDTSVFALPQPAPNPLSLNGAAGKTSRFNAISEYWLFLRLLDQGSVKFVVSFEFCGVVPLVVVYRVCSQDSPG